MQPALRENQKSRLEGVLGILLLPQDTLANAEYPAAMPADQQLEGVAVVVAHEAAQEILIGFSLRRRRTGENGAGGPRHYEVGSRP